MKLYRQSKISEVYDIHLRGVFWIIKYIFINVLHVQESEIIDVG